MTLVVKHQAEDNVVGLIDNRVLVFARSGRLTPAALDAVEALAATYTHRASAEHPVGALALVVGSAGLSDNRLLERQRVLLRGLRAAPHLWFAFCVVGDGVQAVAMRAVVRVLMLGSSTMRLFTDPESAAGWLGAQVGVEPATIRSALATLTP